MSDSLLLKMKLGTSYLHHVFNEIIHFADPSCPKNFIILAESDFVNLFSRIMFYGIIQDAGEADAVNTLAQDADGADADEQKYWIGLYKNPSGEAT